MFPPASATQASSRASAPGRSGTRVRTIRRRPASVSCRRAIESSSPGSTLPPDRIATVVPPAAGATWPPSSAATPTAPAPSTTSLQRSSSTTIASATSSSSTTAIPSSHSPSSGEREVAGPLDRDPVGDRQRRLGRHRPPLLQRGRERGAGGDLHADDLDLRPRRLDRDRDPGGQPAAADRHDQLGEIGHVLEQLEPERALAGHDVRVVERMHERQPALARALVRGGEALVQRRAADVHDRALAARRLGLGDRRVRGDEHLAQHAPRGRGRREPLGVVAGRCGDDAARAALLPQRRQLGRRAAHLERARELEVLGLQRHLPAGALGDRARREDRRAPGHALDLGPRRLYVGGGDAVSPGRQGSRRSRRRPRAGARRRRSCCARAARRRRSRRRRR